ncbi:MAG: hypothetical protein COY58_02020 [Gammaproteobacteria bacterium CG_4_10_14_0_8_um_filter_38_16]|nr:MAG: hypothetical protein COY58_02020 [Gammaproteobacteria bacterium CG_4_10_14_0_8_um_filter_38_16]PJA04091.1 MAG: hypothetical protein COX72_01805 [Gammaproteobacteria bacterium CG_4_10_14_0_2_um_filter_38_22]PJB10043.1 MAG: hypothetical protein CO120_07100 [Gammaproteobacteria bacterium CG_4_9_14_3_um_filter_38_9]
MIQKQFLIRRIFRFALRVVKKLPQLPFFLISLPFTFFLVLLFPFVKIKFIRLCSNRIGHYALNTELLLCYLNQKRIEEKNVKYFFYLLDAPICNTQLHLMWKRVIPILSFAKIVSRIDNTLLFIFGDRYKNSTLKKFEVSEGAVDQLGILKKIKKPNLSFLENEVSEAKRILKQLKIPDNAQFVCLIVRDSGYLNNYYPGHDWRYHDHRDADIAAYKKAALYLADKGYYVLRMGKYVNKKFDIQHPKIIDYANHVLRSDLMDIYLTANCAFCISTCTGLDCVSQIFRKPVLLTNISPHFSETLMWYPCTLLISKQLKNKNSGQLLTLSESAQVCHSISRHVLSEFTQKNLVLIENTDEQLLKVVMQMEAELNEKWHETKDDQLLQEQYWQNYKTHCPVNVKNIYIKIGLNFLKENNRLLLH